MRVLSCPFGFHRDNVEWSEEQAAAAERKVQENSSQRVSPEKQGAHGSSLAGVRSRQWANQVRPPASSATGQTKNSVLGRDGEGTSQESKGLPPNEILVDLGVEFCRLCGLCSEVTSCFIS